MRERNQWEVDESLIPDLSTVEHPDSMKDPSVLEVVRVRGRR